MSLVVGDLVAFLKLEKDDFDQGVDQSGGKFRGLMGGMGKAAVAGGAVVATAMAATARKGLKEFASLERGMNEVFTLLPGISQDAMDELTGQVRDFSRDFGVLPDDVVPALYQALSAGVPQDNVFEFLETANQAALGGVTDLETAVDGISGVVNSYGADMIDAAKASDLMFTAVRLGKTDFGQLSASLFNVLPTAAATNTAFEDIAAAMGTMTAANVPTSVATTQMRQLLVELSKDGGKASDAFKEIAGVGFAEFQKEGGNVADALDLMAQAADDNGVAIQDMFGSVEAGNAALTLAKNNGDDYRAALAEMDDAAGATAAAHEMMDQGLSRSWERIKANISVALGEIGERLAPTFQEFGDWIVANMPAITDFVVGTFETIAGAVNAMRATFDTIRDVIDRVVGWFRTGTGDMAATTGELSDFLGETWEQIREIIDTAVEAITAIFVFFSDFAIDLWERFGEHILDFAAGHFERIKQTIGGVLKVIQGIFDVFAGAFTGDWSRVWGGIKGIFAGVWDVIKALLATAFETIKTILGAGVAVLSAMWDAAWTRIKMFFASIWTSLKTSAREGMADLVGFFRELPGRLLGALGNVSTLLFDAGKKIIQGLIDGVKNMAGAAGDAVKGVASKMRNMLPFSPAKEGPFSGRGAPEFSGRAIMADLAKGVEGEQARLQRAVAGALEGVPALRLDASVTAGRMRGGDGVRAGIHVNGPLIGEVKTLGGDHFPSMKQLEQDMAMRGL